MHPFDELKLYVGFGPEDSQRLKALLDVLEPHIPSVVDRFYQAALGHPQAMRVFEDDAQVDRLRGSLARWLRELCLGPHDAGYYSKRLAIGHTHVRVGLEHRYMFTAMSVVRLAIQEVISQAYPPEGREPIVASLHRILDLELAIMLGTYTAERSQRDLVELRDLIMRHLPITALLLDHEARVVAATSPVPGVTAGPRPLGLSFERYLPEALARRPEIGAAITLSQDTRQVQSVPRLDVSMREARVRGRQRRSYRITAVPLEHELADTLLHVEDLTEPLQQEAEARHKANLAELGTMAATVAHELRNPLAGISGTMQVIRGSFGEDDRRATVMGKVLEQVERLNSLVQDLLQFSRPIEATCRAHRLETIAAHVPHQLVPEYAEQLEIQGEGHALADPGLLGAVIVNLVLNAFQAGAERVQLHLEDGGLRVVDDGPGVPEDVQESIFQPFFTTRTRGTGLGLPNARRSIEAMGGTLELCESPLGGAGFEVELAPVTRALPR